MAENEMNDDDIVMYEAFKIFDKDGNQKISSSYTHIFIANELSSVFRSLGYNFTPQNIQEMLLDIDKDADDALNFEEFCSLLKKQEEKINKGEDELIDAFRGRLLCHMIRSVFDRDGNGVITAEELK